MCWECVLSVCVGSERSMQWCELKGFSGADLPEVEGQDRFSVYKFGCAVGVTSSFRAVPFNR